MVQPCCSLHWCYLCLHWFSNVYYLVVVYIAVIYTVFIRGVCYMNWELHESKKLAFCIVCQCYIVIVYIGVDSVSPYCET